MMHQPVDGDPEREPFNSKVDSIISWRAERYSFKYSN